MPTSREIFNTLAEKSRTPELTGSFYEALLSTVEDAIAMNTPEERDEAIRSAYQTVTNMAAKNALIHRGIMSWSQELEDKYNGNTYISAMDTSNAVEQLFGQICQELGGYQCKPMMGMTGQDYMDYIRALANSVMMKDVQDEFFKQATASTLADSLERYVNNLPSPDEHSYSEDFSVPANRNVAEVYSLYENAWDRIKERGFFGNLIHPIDFFRTVGVIRTAGRMLDKFGFNKEIHGPAAKDAFESTVDACSGKDMADLAELKDDIKAVDAYNMAKANKVEETRMARDKLEQAIAKANSPDSPLNKVNAVLAKYGTAAEIDHARPGRIGSFNVTPEESIADQYDVRREKDAFKDYVKTVFFRGVEMLVRAKHEKQNERINVKELIKDASDLAVIMASEFTVLYEAPDLKDIAKNSAFGGYDVDGIARVVNRAINVSGNSFQYNADDLKAEIGEAVAEYKNPIIENSIREKIEELADDVNAEHTNDVVKEENTVQKVNETEIEETMENDIMRISVDLFSDAPEAEQAQSKIEEQTLDKSGITK